MTRGRHICNTLKAIRKEIADANDIHYEPHDCKHEGPCRGTCPACEAEVRYLETELSRRRRLGRAVAVVGVAAGLAAGLGACSSKKAVTEIEEPLGGEVMVEPEVLNPAEPHMLMGKPVVPAEELEQFNATTLQPADTSANLKTVIVGDITEQMPQFPGGEVALTKYIAQNFRYPDSCESAGGRIVVSFYVETDGSITEVGIVKSPGPEFDREAMRLVSTMPKWTPGQRNGKPARMKYTIPLTICPQQ